MLVMHRTDSWGTLRLVTRIKGFSQRVQLFKPRRAHAKKASFYLVARGVKPGSSTAGEAVETWRRLWRAAPFGKGVGKVGEDGDGEGRQ